VCVPAGSIPAGPLLRPGRSRSWAREGFQQGRRHELSVDVDSWEEVDPLPSGVSNEQAADQSGQLTPI
jgi:hypothetical protein